MSVLFPDVPIAAGVPPVLRALGLTYQEETYSVSYTKDASADQGTRWGVLDAEGNIAIEPDSFGMVEYAKEYRISDFPVEDGGFQSFNKVETPYEARVMLLKGGTDAERQDFLNDVEAAVSSLDLYSIMTPSRTYLNANLTRYDYAQSSQGGATLLRLELAFEQVRNTATTTFTNSKDAASADVVNDGSVQTTAPTPEQTPEDAPQ